MIISDDMCKGDERLGKILLGSYLCDILSLDRTAVPGLGVYQPAQGVVILSDALKQEWLAKGYIKPNIAGSGCYSIPYCCECRMAGVRLTKGSCDRCSARDNVVRELSPRAAYLLALMYNGDLVQQKSLYCLTDGNDSERQVCLWEVSREVEELAHHGLIRRVSSDEPATEEVWEKVPEDEWKPKEEISNESSQENNQEGSSETSP